MGNQENRLVHVLDKIDIEFIDDGDVYSLPISEKLINELFDVEE